MDEHRKMAEEIVSESFDVEKTVEVFRQNGLTKTADEYLLGSGECVARIADALRTTASKSEKDGYRIAAQEADRIKSHSTNHEDRRHTIHCYYADVGGAIRGLIREEEK